MLFFSFFFACGIVLLLFAYMNFFWLALVFVYNLLLLGKGIKGLFHFRICAFFCIIFLYSHFLSCSLSPAYSLALDLRILFAIVCTSYQIKMLVTFTYRGNTLTPHTSIYRSYCSLCHDVLVVS